LRSQAGGALDPFVFEQGYGGGERAGVSLVDAVAGVKAGGGGAMALLGSLTHEGAGFGQALHGDDAGDVSE
jgi:hypothetical protein